MDKEKPNTPYMDRILYELQQTWGYTIEELYDIKSRMANFGLACLMDSHVAQEAECICHEEAFSDET